MPSITTTFQFIFWSLQLISLLNQMVYIFIKSKLIFIIRASLYMWGHSYHQQSQSEWYADMRYCEKIVWQYPNWCTSEGHYSRTMQGCTLKGLCQVMVDFLRHQIVNILLWSAIPPNLWHVLQLYQHPMTLSELGKKIISHIIHHILNPWQNKDTHFFSPLGVLVCKSTYINPT